MERETRQIICISCPIGCPLTVGLEDGKVVAVEGQGCKRGQVYAEKECTNPTRIVTSTVRVEGGVLEMLPVKTAGDIPKGKIFDCVKALEDVVAKAPVDIGEVVLADAAGAGVDVVATRRVDAR